MILFGLGVAVGVVGATILADEWRRSRQPKAVVLGLGVRFELVAVAAVLLGLAAALVFAGCR